jgi:O-antigen ligase
MTRERLDIWCEKGILFLVLAILVFGPLATGAVRPLEFLIIQGLTMGAVLLWMLRCWLNPDHPLFWPPICWTVMAFVIYAILRYRQADLEYVARQELIRILVYALLFFVILNNLARQESTQLLSCVLIFLGMAIAMYAIYQFATNSEYVWHFIKPAGYRNRGSGTYICPNHLAGFLEMLLPVGLAYTLIGRIGHLLRVFLGYSCLIVLAGIGVSISRGGWLATLVALLLFFGLLIRRREYRIPALLIVVLLVVSGAFFYTTTDRARKRLESALAADSHDTGWTRFWIWKPALQMWQDHPWLGIGPAQFDDRFPAYRPAEIQARPGYSHNDYLQTLAEWGLFGAGLIAASWALLFVGVFKTWRFVFRESNGLGPGLGNRAAFVCGAAIGLTAILIHSLVDFNMHVPANAILAITLMAILAGYQRFSTERYWVGLRWPGCLLVTGVILTALAFAAQQGWRRARESTCLERAASERTYSPTKIAALKTAHAIEPANYETTYAIGEALRQLSWQGYAGYEKLAQEAIEWFRRGIRLNPYDPYNYMKIGMCMDWLEQHAEAAPYYEEAVKRDPNNYYVVAHQGWHFIQTKDYQTAKSWFERSIKIRWWDNPIPYSYFPFIEQRLKEAGNSK